MLENKSYPECQELKYNILIFYDLAGNFAILKSTSRIFQALVYKSSMIAFGQLSPAIIISVVEFSPRTSIHIRQRNHIKRRQNFKREGNLLFWKDTSRTFLIKSQPANFPQVSLSPGSLIYILNYPNPPKRRSIIFSRPPFRDIHRLLVRAIPHPQLTLSLCIFLSQENYI